MSVFLGKAGKMVFEKHMENYAPKDPYYEEYTTPNGKKKRRRVRDQACIGHVAVC